MNIMPREVDIANLLQLAEDKSATGRNQLFDQIGHLLIDEGVIANDQERALMVEILNKLVREVEMQVRQSLSQKLAKNPRAPSQLVVMLANDEIEVARPVLMASDILRDEELLQVIKHRTQEHQMAIAMREQVSEVVSSALVEAGHQDVITQLLQNQNAKISQATLEYLVEQSERVDTYQNPLLSRNDLRPEMAKKMFLWVSQSLKEKIVADFQLPPEEVEQLVHESVEYAAHHQSPDSYAKTQELVEAIAKSKELTPGLLAKALRDGEIPLFIGLFGKMTDLDLPTAKKIVFEAEGEVMALACKAIGFETHQFADLYKLIRITRSNSRDVRITEMSHLLSYYEQMKKVTAQNILRSWQRQPDYLDAINQKSSRKRNAAVPPRLSHPNN